MQNITPSPTPTPKWAVKLASDLHLIKHGTQLSNITQDKGFLRNSNKSKIYALAKSPSR